MLPTLIFFVMLVIVFYCYWRHQRRRKYELCRDLPAFPEWPLIGHLHLFIGNPQYLMTLLERVSKKCNDNDGIMKLWFGPLLYIIVTKPEYAEAIANKCLDKEWLYGFGLGLMGEGLVIQNGDAWKNCIKRLLPAFNQNVLDSFIGLFNEQSRFMVENMRCEVDKPPFDAEHYVSPIVLETVCQTTMGVPMDDKKTVVDKRYFEIVSGVLNLLTKRALTPYLHSDFIYFNLPIGKREKKLTDQLNDFTDTLIQRKKEKLKQKLAQKSNEVQSEEFDGKKHKFKAFLDLILEYEGDNAFPDREIRDHVKTMVIAGLETTTLTMRMVLVRIGAHQEMQEKIYQELQSVFGDSYREVEKDDLPKLVYTEAFIKEALRHHPPLAFTGRKTGAQEVQMKEHTVPAYTGVIVSQWGLNRYEPTWGPDAYEFRPDRFLPPESKPGNPYGYGSFSYGKRVCIGKKYGLMSMKTTVANLLRIYKLKADITNLKFALDVTMKPISGHYLQIELRE